MHNFVEEIKASFGCKFRESSVTHFLSDFICFAENQKSKSTDQYMLHSSGQIKACMTSKQYTFENNVTFHFDRKTVLQYEKKPCICVFRRKKVAIR